MSHCHITRILLFHFSIVTRHLSAVFVCRRRKEEKKHVFVFKNETLHDVNNPCEMAMQINLSYWQTRQLPMQIKAKIETELCFLSFFIIYTMRCKSKHRSQYAKTKRNSRKTWRAKKTNNNNNQRRFYGRSQEKTIW